MRQYKVVRAYDITEELSKDENLSIAAKWVLYKLRKELAHYRDFYYEESKKLFDHYDTEVNGDTITFKSPELAREYQIKQNEIDSFEIEPRYAKQPLKLSDVPNITIQQIEELDDFILFEPN